MPQSNLVFLVDDSADFRFLVKSVFSRFLPAYQLHVFDSGEALSQHTLHAAQQPGLILLDYHMPGLNGYQTLQALKQHPHWQTIPVAMLSSDASPEEIEACYRSGVNSFSKKPLGLVALQELLESICHH